MKSLSDTMAIFYNSNHGKSVTEIRSLLMPHKRELETLYTKYSKQDNDYRSGRETYGYGSEELIQNTVHYISDRYETAFRIRWILDLLELEERQK